MQQEIRVTVVGNVATEPTLRHASDGTPYVSFRVASTPRHRSKEGEWIDGHTSYVSVTAWRSLATHIHNSVKKGWPVVVEGRVKISQAERQVGDEKIPQQFIDISATSVSVPLQFGTVDFHRTKSAAVAEVERRALTDALGESASTSDPWGESAVA